VRVRVPVCPLARFLCHGRQANEEAAARNCDIARHDRQRFGCRHARQGAGLELDRILHRRDIGIGWATSKDNRFADPNDVAFEACGPCFLGGFGPQDITLRGSGILGGVHAGYNLQITPVALIGIEGDFTWTGIKPSSNTPLTAFFAPGVLSPAAGSNLNVQTTIDSLASVRARAGFVQKNWLAYVTGGVAWADLDFNANAFCSNPACNSFTVQSSSSINKMRTGVVWGGGFELQAPASSLRARVEYLYYAFNGTDSASPLWIGGPCQGSPCVANFGSGNVSVQTVRLGVSYAFH
jgi:outer membrane immunogenic protein